MNKPFTKEQFDNQYKWGGVKFNIKILHFCSLGGVLLFIAATVLWSNYYYNDNTINSLIWYVALGAIVHIGQIYCIMHTIDVYTSIGSIEYDRLVESDKSLYLAVNVAEDNYYHKVKSADFVVTQLPFYSVLAVVMIYKPDDKLFICMLLHMFTMVSFAYLARQIVNKDSDNEFELYIKKR